MVSARQIRAARAWLGLSAGELGKLAKCSRDTIRRFEAGREHQLRPTTEAAIRTALETRGVQFIFSREGEPIGIEGRA